MGQRKPLMWNGGVNLYADPRGIKDDQLAYGKNAFPTLEGLLHKRESVQAVGWTQHKSAGGTILGAQPVALFAPDQITGADFILHGHYGPGTIAGEWLAAVSMNVAIQHGPGPSTYHPSVYALTAVAGSPPARPASFANYRGRVIALAGGNEGFAQYVRGATGFAPDAWSWVRASFAWAATEPGVGAAQTQTIQVNPQVCGSFRGRMVYANFGPGMGHWMVWADLNAGVIPHTNVTTAPLWARIGTDALTENGNHVELQAIVGEDICSIQEVSLSSITNPLQTAFLVLTKQGSAVIITGEPVQTTDTQFSNADGFLGSLPGHVSKVNFRCGGSGPGSRCSSPYGEFWCSNEDVWMMPSSAPHPVRVGTNIRPAIKAVPPALRQYISMAYADAVLYLSLPTQGSSSERNMAVEHWRLDLYDGPPQGPMDAQWYGPQDYTQLSTWLGAGQTMFNQEEACLSPSIVTKMIGDREVVYGVCMAVNHNDVPRTFFVSFNEDTRATDVPFETTSSGLVWKAYDGTNAYGAGTVIRPSALAANGHLYIAQNAGIQAVVEPAWPTGAGATVIDGAVTWEEIQGTTFWIRLVNFYAKNAIHAISMDVKFKDDDWGNPGRDKILRRIDISAYFATRAWSVFRAILNQGNRVGQLGPVALGDFTSTAGLIPAYGDLGTMELDTSALATEFQAKTYKPRLLTQQLRSPEGGSVTGTISDMGIIRARSIQPNFCDLPGIVIDDTNDYISWGSVDSATGILGPIRTIQLTHGYYANVEALMTYLAGAMRDAQGLQTGFTNVAWDHDDAYAAAFPYMTTFRVSFSSRTAGWRMVFIFGSAITISPIVEDTTYWNGDITTQPVTCYPGRTKRLLEMLGFDVSNTYGVAMGIVGTYTDGRLVQAVGEQNTPVLASPTAICGIEVIPYQRPAHIRIASLEIEAAVMPGLPFTGRNREPA